MFYTLKRSFSMCFHSADHINTLNIMVQYSVPNNQQKPAFPCVFFIVSIFTMLNSFVHCMNSMRQHVQCWTQCKQAVFGLFHVLNVLHYENKLIDWYNKIYVYPPYKPAGLSCFTFTMFYTMKTSFSISFHKTDHI